MKKICQVLAFILIVAAVQQSALAQAPKKIGADKQRALQWKPEKGQYYFSHSLVFDYQNKADKTSGKLKIYLDPVTGAMCFKKESSFGEGGKAFDFVIAFPDGKYIYCGTDENSKKIRINELVKELKRDAETKAEQKENFTTYCIPTGNKRVDFGLTSEEYDITYATSDNKDKVWLTQTPFSVYPLYGMEFVEGAVSLPVTFDYMHLLQSNQLVTEINSKDLILKLVSLEKDPFLAITKGYQELKVND
ncbi:hypothetical protein [Dyadobacter sp. Leaf189]|uniref:hypothetical protein n=1 Tax=Dyadobacter sp. Leaf189 TaxID=1736295 RepID=UPI00070173CB|nr:hypothetical protein [Dyadobacter sp. Leaf189]KQS31481.1 hypothetical protein ASG33_14335 [Dyadobacter sp. Leaf189]